MGATDLERPDAAAPRVRFEIACWFVATVVSAGGVIAGVATLTAPGLFAATACGVNIVVLVDRARSRRASLLVWFWSLLLVLVAPLVLALATRGATVILLMDAPTSHAPAVAGLLIGFVASCVALRVWHAFRPARWHCVAFFAPLLCLFALLASSRAMRWLEELLHGPAPEEGVAALMWHHTVGDSTERVLAWLLLTWTVFFLAGAIRGALVSRPADPPPPRLGPPDAVGGAPQRSRLGGLVWWIALIAALAGTTDAVTRGFAADSAGTAMAWMLAAVFWTVMLVALAAARRSRGFQWLCYLWSLLTVAALPFAASAVVELVRRSIGGTLRPGPWTSDSWPPGVLAPDALSPWFLAIAAAGLPVAALALRAREAFTPSWRQSVIFIPPLAWCFVVATSRDVAWWIDGRFFSASWDGHLPHWASSTDVGPLAGASFGALWLTYFLLGAGRSIVLRRPVEDPRIAVRPGVRADGPVAARGA